MARAPNQPNRRSGVSRNRDGPVVDGDDAGVASVGGYNCSLHFHFHFMGVKVGPLF